MHTDNRPDGSSVAAGALPIVPATATYAEVMSTMSMVEVRKRLQALNESDAVLGMIGNDVRWVAAGIIDRPMQPLELIQWEKGAESETGRPPSDEDLRNLCRNYHLFVSRAVPFFLPHPRFPLRPLPAVRGAGRRRPGGHVDGAGPLP